jgi:hypothetical protein
MAIVVIIVLNRFIDETNFIRRKDLRTSTTSKNSVLPLTSSLSISLSSIVSTMPAIKPLKITIESNLELNFIKIKNFRSFYVVVLMVLKHRLPI